MIPDHKKEEIRQAADIVEVVGDHVKLKRSGSGYIGLCPFHNEKSPSFHVTPKMGIYKCFGCGVGGDVFQFVMQMDGVGFNEAMRSLAARYNIDVPDERDESASDPEYQRKEGVYHALRFAGVYFHSQLMETDEAETARNYLKTRGFTRDTIVKAGLGYAPSNGDSLYRAATGSGIQPDYLIDAGLVRVDDSGNRHYDYFRGRLIFPIFNPSSKVIAFAGRILGNEKTAKYINSPQTIVYNKSEVLYGIHQARNEIRKSSIAILVEGYTDVLSLFQAGVGNVVASSGTALTAEQVRLIHRYGETLLMIYDSDAAGQTAMIRGMDVAISEGLEVRMLELPEGEDPDSFVRQFGGEAFKTYAEESSADFLSFMINKARISKAWDDPGRKQKSISRMLRSIALMKEPVKRETYVQHLSQGARIGDRSLFEELGMIISRNNRDHKQQANREQNQITTARSTEQRGELGNRIPPPVPAIRRAAEKDVLRIMLTYGNPIVEFIGSYSNAEHFEDPDFRDLYTDIISNWENGKNISLSLYTDREPPFPVLVSEIVVDRHNVSDRSTKRIGKLVQRDPEPYKAAQGALKALKLQYLERLRSVYEKELNAATDAAQLQSVQRLITKVTALKSKMETAPLDDLFPGAPHDASVPENDVNPYRAEDYISKKKK